MALPIVFFDYIQSFRFEKALMKGAQYTVDHVTGYVREFVFNPETSDENVRKILDYDIKEIPLYGNQEVYWRDLEIIDSFGGFQPAPKVQTLQLCQILLYQTQCQLHQLPR